MGVEGTSARSRSALHFVLGPDLAEAQRLARTARVSFSRARSDLLRQRHIHLRELAELLAGFTNADRAMTSLSSAQFEAGLAATSHRDRRHSLNVVELDRLEIVRLGGGRCGLGALSTWTSSSLTRAKRAALGWRSVHRRAWARRGDLYVRHRADVMAWRMK